MVSETKAQKIYNAYGAHGNIAIVGLTKESRDFVYDNAKSRSIVDGVENFEMDDGSFIFIDDEDIFLGHR